MKPPLPNSYWVLPGRLLAGEHPAGRDDTATRRRVDLLLAAGVRSFVDLTADEEMPAYAAWLPEQTEYINLPIPDHSVPPDPARMHAILSALAAGLSGDDGVYVHCRAGIGRTGTVIGCWLRERGAAPQAALDQLNRLWRQNARAARWPSIPETAEQESYILEWQAGVRNATFA
jgi:Swiss Army Knife protein, DSP-PTPase phosphatase domain